jgi:DinB superfamily
MTLETIIKQYDFNLAYAEQLVWDVPNELMCELPAKGLENHPAFTLGHLVSGSALLVEDLGGKLEMPESWAELFARNGPGDARMPDLNKYAYPSKSELLNELERQHEKVKQLLSKMDAGKLNSNFSWRFSSYIPTLLDLITFMCITHEAMHLAQLAAWRRAMNLPSALARL